MMPLCRESPRPERRQAVLGYYNATLKYLAGPSCQRRDRGGWGCFSGHAAEEVASEDLQMEPRNQILTGGTRGPVGATDRRYALDELDQYGQPRRNLATAMPLGGDRGFSSRFPEADRIRTV
jgi:hypothetical protein